MQRASTGSWSLGGVSQFDSDDDAEHDDFEELDDFEEAGLDAGGADRDRDDDIGGDGDGEGWAPLEIWPAGFGEDEEDAGPGSADDLPKNLLMRNHFIIMAGDYFGQALAGAHRRHRRVRRR